MRARAYLNPRRAGQDGRPHAIASFAAGVITRRLDRALPSLSAPDRQPIADWPADFLAHCDATGLPLDWRASLWLSSWLDHRVEGPLDVALRLECLACAAIAWATELFVDLNAMRMLLHDRRGGLTVGAIRPVHFTDLPRVIRLQVDDIAAGAGDFARAISTAPDRWQPRDWITP